MKAFSKEYFEQLLYLTINTLSIVLDIKQKAYHHIIALKRLSAAMQVIITSV